MSNTTFAVGDSNAVKIWSKMLVYAERDTLEIAPLMGDDEDSIIQVKSELQKGPGDQVKFNLITRLSGDGKTENETAEGNGEALTHYQDSLVINELGHVVGVRSENSIDQQRVPWDLRDQAKRRLADWWMDRKAAWFFNHVCGNVAQSNTKYTGMNAVTAHTSGRRLWAGSATTDQGLTSSDVFTLDLIDKAVELAEVGSNKIRRIRVGGGKKFVMYLHPYQVTALRTNYSTGQWGDIQKAALMGQQSTKHPIYTDALGEYHDVVLRKSQDIPLGCHSTGNTAVSSTRRAVLLGAQAAVMAFGQKTTGGNKYRWNEELLDHKRNLEVSAWLIGGLKKTVFNSADFGCITVSTYAAASA